MKNFIKTLALVVMAIMLTMSFVGCDGDPQDSSSGSTSGSSSSSSGSTPSIYLTCIGQCDLDIAEDLMNTAGYYTQEDITEDELEPSEYKGVIVVNNTLTANQVPTDAKVFIVVGSSGKGLGEGGINAAHETTRANDFAAASTTRDIYVLHVGRSTRRGTISDGFIDAIAPFSKKCIVVDDGAGNGGNYDGHFTTICTTAGQLVVVANNSGVVSQITSILSD